MKQDRLSLKIHLLIQMICVLAISAWPDPVNATATEKVFDTFKDRLLQIRIVDNSTNSKTTIGSGFFIDRQGSIVTNYHVVSKHVFKPEQYRIEYVTSDDKTHNAKLVNVDVVHDLAILDGNINDTPFLSLNELKLDKGSRIYTLGNPLDLGMTIVEGTYNGTTDDTMHERILLSSALNPGMSGGPSIIDDGTVIGVNVATAGNSIGFLVPRKFLNVLVKQSRSKEKKDFIEIIRKQLLKNQDNYLGKLLKNPFPKKKLGNYTVPAKIADYINCWGDSKENSGLFRTSDNYCATKNDIFLNQRISTGDIRYTHQYLHSEKMNSIRFYNLLTSYFKDPDTSLSGHKDDFTEFNCKTDFIESRNILFRTAFCLRRYKKLKNLYDMVLTAGSITDNTNGIVTSLVLAGVSYGNAVKFSKKYLEAFAWKRP